MTRHISADLVITNDGPPLENASILVDEASGVIIDVIQNDGVVKDSTIHYEGVLVPGYINAHCHLELSHLNGIIDTGTGLIPFIKGVVTLRDFPDDVIQKAIVAADQYMYDNGIVAVGDISNKDDTALTKDLSKIRYYTFVEMFDFLQEDQARLTFDQAAKVFAKQSDKGKNKKSFVPHAPYSVSKSLFKFINEHNQTGDTISIHNQELDAENQLFIDGSGEFLEFFRSFNIDIEGFEPIGSSSLQYAIDHLEPRFKTLMVHNTKTPVADILSAHSWHHEVYWVTCPNANLYIENTLPSHHNLKPLRH